MLAWKSTKLSIFWQFIYNISRKSSGNSGMLRWAEWNPWRLFEWEGGEQLAASWEKLKLLHSVFWMLQINPSPGQWNLKILYLNFYQQDYAEYRNIFGHHLDTIDKNDTFAGNKVLLMIFWIVTAKQFWFSCHGRLEPQTVRQSLHRFKRGKLTPGLIRKEAVFIFPKKPYSRWFIKSHRIDKILMYIKTFFHFLNICIFSDLIFPNCRELSWLSQSVFFWSRKDQSHIALSSIQRNQTIS